jgi:hypothetical protein
MMYLMGVEAIADGFARWVMLLPFMDQFVK